MDRFAEPWIICSIGIDCAAVWRYDKSVGVPLEGAGEELHMTFESCVKSARDQKLAGIRYEKSGRHHFRDRVTVYRDGRLLFERFCYGEAAGLVFSMWGRGEGEKAVWDYDSCAVSAKTEAPVELTGGDETSLLFDGKSWTWDAAALLKADPENGYGRLRVLFGK